MRPNPWTMPLIASVACFALCLATLIPWMPRVVAGVVNLVLQFASGFLLGLMLERKRRYEDAITHQNEMIRAHRSFHEFVQHMDAELERVAPRVRQ